MLPAEMRAVVIADTQGPGAARVERVPVPELRPRHVLVKVRAAGVNYADVMQSLGYYEGGPTPPYVAGIEAAGEVVAVGESAGAQIGDRVIGFGASAFAEYVLWPAGGTMPLPTGWTFEQGAAFGVQWFTAHACLRTCGRLCAGESVLIHAAAGGVGQAAVRLAKHFGARVFATASSPEKLAIAGRLGADVLIDYTREDFVEVVRERTNGRGVDLILEMVGGDTFRKNLEAAVAFGRIVVFGAASGEMAKVGNRELIFRPVELVGYHLGVMQRKRPDLMMRQLVEVRELIERGVIVPDAPTALPLDRASEALTNLRARATTGKLVLVP